MHASKSVVQGLALSAALLITLLFWASVGALAQESMATLRGTVQNQSGAPLAGTVVMVKNLETGLSRTVSSDAEGLFEILELAPGIYEVQASRTSFGVKTQEGLRLAAGELVSLDFILEPDSEAPSGATANLISEDQLVGLPLNGRSYSQLATLQAGVSDPSAASASRGFGSGSLTVSGGRSTSNNFLLDGTNIMNTHNRAPQSAAGGQLGSDAVLQVQVLSAYGAEYGRGSGGVLNSITRSGSNEFHGNFFEFFRNSKLDARNFFDGPEPPPFKRNQFGFTLTGPVRKERTFFMGSFEGLRDRLTETQVNFFPDEMARQGIIADADGTILNECADESSRPYCVHPEVRKYLPLYPLPNSGPIGGGFARNTDSQFLPTDENFFVIRVDHKVSDQDSLFIRYTFDDATSTSGQGVFLWRTLTQSRQQYLTLVGTHIFSPSVLTSSRFGYTRPVNAIDTLSAIEIPRSLFFVSDAPQFGQISIPGTAAFGPATSTPEVNIMNTFQLAEDVVVQRGPHALKFGFDIHRYRWDVFNSSRKGAEWSFNSLESFLTGGADGTTNLIVALPGSDNRKAFRQTLAGFYIQDVYAVNSRFQLNLGLRYEFTTILHDRDGKTVFLPDPVHEQALQLGPILQDNPSLYNLAPRLGMTWSPFGGRNTVLRGSFGIYYDQLLEYVVDRQKNSAPFYKRAILTNFDSSGTFPNAVAAAATTPFGTPLGVAILDYHHMSNPMMLRYNFALQQVFPGDWRVQAAYVGARGNHLFRGYEANLYPVPSTLPDGSLFFPPNEGPINPAFGSISITSTDAQSFYNSLQLSANKSLSRGFSLRANYTYSKSVDDASTFSSASSSAASRQYPLMRTLDRGLSDFDIRHRLVINYFYTLPAGNRQGGWKSSVLSQILGGWRLGGIMRFRTGTPFTSRVRVQTEGFLFAANRPNLLPGKSNNPILGSPDQYFDPSVYSVPPPGTLGNSGRNTVIAPSMFSMDVSFQREFLLDAKRRIQFRAEFFNLPNHPNFGGNQRGSSVVFSGSSGRPNPTAGRIINTVTTARQIQFALRFSF